VTRDVKPSWGVGRSAGRLRGVTLEFRETRPEEYRIAADVMSAALMTRPYSDERWDKALPAWDEMVSYSAWDDGACVGHAGQYIVDTLVPGGALVPTGAVTRVGVLPTARRRGIARSLMHELIRDSERRGFPLMSLRASESTIYERFGFGLAGEFCQITLDPVRASPIRGATSDGTFRLLRGDEILDVIPDLYHRVAFRRPGIITRPRPLSEELFRDAIEGDKASFVVVHTGADGVDDGYAHYETEWDDDHPDGSTGRGEIFDVFGASNATELALWQYLCHVDLVTRWKASERPVDDIVRYAANDSRAHRTRAIDDEQWVRLIDPDAALSARSYRAVSGSVTIKITDHVLPANTGTWRVSANGAERVDDEPDLDGGVAGVSAAYLGGRSWTTLVATGRVDELTPGAAALADDLFATVPLPFTGTFF
jgi:predicted acetyltransferase